MSYPTTFANLAAGNEPASLFDTMFNIAGQQGNLPCTASGTNAITLTPETNYYLPAAYTDKQLASFEAVATSTGAMTMQLGGLGLVNLYVPAGTQAGAGNVVINTNYVVQYLASLNSGAGGFIIINSSLPSVAQPIQGAFRNLVLTNTTSATPTTQVTPSASQLILQNSAGGTVTITNYAPPVTSTAASGANGIDTGSVAANTWYAFWAIYNATTATAAGLLSTSFTSPTLPSGYTYSALLGAFLTDSASNLYYTIQNGTRVRYVVTNTTGKSPQYSINIANGTAGTTSSTTASLVSASTAGYVPVIADEVRLLVSNCRGATSAAFVQVAPNTNYSGAQNSTSGSNGNIFNAYINNLTSMFINNTTPIYLEQASVWWASSNSEGAIGVIGYTLNL